MLEIIYNDCYSQLTLVNNLDNEKVVIVDDDFKVYEEISFSEIQPSNEDFINAFERALKTYFCIDNKKEPLKLYRQNMVDNSIGAFKEWLEKGGMY